MSWGEGVLSGQYLDLLAENKKFRLTLNNFKEIQKKLFVNSILLLQVLS